MSTAAVSMLGKKPQVSEQMVPGAHAVQGHHRRPWLWRVSICGIILLIVAIVVPVAVILTRKKSAPVMSTKANVIVPLYVYPDTQASAWGPLFNVANSSSALNYTVIVNPLSGPGPNALPDSNYITGITMLNGLPNVKTIGYVPTNYTVRNINDVVNDVNVYANWSKANTQLTLNGIFFDESPFEYNDDIVAYVSTIRDAVNNADGIASDKMIVYNPGTVPDGPLYYSPDLVVTFEDTYANFTGSDLSYMSANRTQYCSMVHSTPNTADLTALVTKMAKSANYLFVTDLAGNPSGSINPYGQFGSIWNSFINAMSATG
ncbi:hypothetical protein AMS68_001371 [Peltaster fructicola]|uniref:Spherulin 4-like cell surface protein n=1 Tax=Peltaster fructicola TaxID=286661 RepID=A0A6H0XMA2_9PEZI|nr:hypothetical protein AMS68_001371 [Peltaster fructicola]